MVGGALNGGIDGEARSAAGGGGDASHPVDGEALLRLVERAAVARVDLKVTDLLGRWHHLSVPARSLDARTLGRGWTVESGALPGLGEVGGEPLRLRPDADTAVVDPTADPPTLSLICDVLRADSDGPEGGCVRGATRRAERYLAAQSPSLTARVGVTVEFFVFDDVRFQHGANAAFYAVDSIEGSWNTGAEETPNLGYKLRGSGWGELAGDAYAALRADIVGALEAIGVGVLADRHGASGPGHQSITLAEDGPLAVADAVQWARHFARLLARRRGLVATFMPRPFGGRGSTLPVTQSLWDGDRALLRDPNGYGALSREGRWFVGGLLRNGPPVAALLMPTSNSYRGWSGEEDAPVHLVYGMRSTTGAVRIPSGEGEGRVAYRAVDAAANPYLALAALLVAGYDGVRHRYDAGDPLDRSPGDLDPAAHAALRLLPLSLDEALRELEAATALLARDDVFTEELLGRWCEQKRGELARLAAEPTPVEYDLYFNG